MLPWTLGVSDDRRSATPPDRSVVTSSTAGPVTRGRRAPFRGDRLPAVWATQSVSTTGHYLSLVVVDPMYGGSTLVASVRQLLTRESLLPPMIPKPECSGPDVLSMPAAADAVAFGTVDVPLPAIPTARPTSGCIPTRSTRCSRNSLPAWDGPGFHPRILWASGNGRRPSRQNSIVRHGHRAIPPFLATSRGSRSRSEPSPYKRPPLLLACRSPCHSYGL
jgi:hypothetical protein